MRPYSAGESLEDFCRACKIDRMHTVIAVDVNSGIVGRRTRRNREESMTQTGRHRLLGKLFPRRAGTPAEEDETGAPPSPPPVSSAPRNSPRAAASREPSAIVSDRERTAPPMSVDRNVDIEMLLRRIIREETGLTAVTPAEKWRGGSLVLRPGTSGLQEKTWPVETFFHKVVMIRNRLRTLEQQINAADLPDDMKVKLQGYISGCYGSLTSFNVLFADEDDQFKGGAGE